MDNIGSGLLLFYSILAAPIILIVVLLTAYWGWVFLYLFLIFALGVSITAKISRVCHISKPFFRSFFIIPLLLFIMLVLDFFIFKMLGDYFIVAVLILYVLINFIIRYLVQNKLTWYAYFLEQNNTAIPLKLRPNGPQRISIYSKTFAILYKKNSPKTIASIFNNHLYSPSEIVVSNDSKSWFFEALNSFCQQYPDLPYPLVRNYFRGQVELLTHPGILDYWSSQIQIKSHHQAVLLHVFNAVIKELERFIKAPKKGPDSGWDSAPDSTLFLTPNFLATAQFLEQVNYDDSVLQERGQYLSSLMFLAQGLAKNL